MDINRFEALLEALRAGDSADTSQACVDLMHIWKEVPVEELLQLKNRFEKMGLTDREARLDEALASIAERRPAPFTAIVTNSGHPLWKESVEVLSTVGCENYLELFISLLPSCPEKQLVDLVRAIGCYKDKRAVNTLSKYLGSSDEELFLESVLALKRSGRPEALSILRDIQQDRAGNGSDMSGVLGAIVDEMAGEMEGA